MEKFDFDINVFRSLYRESENKAIEYLEKRLNNKLSIPPGQVQNIWRFISWSSGILSESFIEKFKNELEWNEIVQEQNLSFDFLIKHISKVNKRDLKINPYITQEMKNKIFDYMNLLH
jgi:hypothetical protein